MGIPSGQLVLCDTVLHMNTMAKERQSLGALFAHARTLLGPHFPRLFLLGGFAAAVGILEVLLLYLLANIGVSLVSREEGTLLALGPLELGEIALKDQLLFAVLVLAFLLSLSLPLARTAARTSEIAIARTRRRLADAYLNSNWADRSSDSEGHFQAMLTEYSFRAERLILQISTLVVALCALTLLAISMVAIAPVGSVLGLTVLGLFALALRPLSKKVRSSSKWHAAVDKDFAGAVAQTARVSQEIVAFNVHEAVLDTMYESIDKSANKLRSLRLFQRLVPMLYQYGAIAAIVGLIPLLSVVDPRSVSVAGPALLTLLRALNYSKQAQSAAQAANEFAPYALAVETELARLQAARRSDGTVDAKGFERIRFVDVGFEYEGNRPVFTSVNFTITAGEAIAVVGPSGSGKSTFVQLLLRLRAPTYGSINIDGIDLQQFEADSLASNFAFVPQDNKLIHGSVADNIRFFRSGYDLESVRTAATAAHLHEEIASLPKGYDTIVGPGAADLSGGQRQRLGIARALLGWPTLLVLDEPTSALDIVSESLIRTTLQERKRHMTLIIIAHRPATLDICDRVLSVADGEISETTKAAL